MRYPKISKCLCTGSIHIQMCIIYKVSIELRLCIHFQITIYLVHTQYEISQDQHICVHWFESFSEVYNLHVLVLNEIDFYISRLEHTWCIHSMRYRKISMCVCSGSNHIQKCIIYKVSIELRLCYTFPDYNIPGSHT